MKTAISISDGLFEKATRLSKELRVPRSRLIAEALREYLEKIENRKILREINAAYGDGDERPAETDSLRGALRRHKELLLDEDRW